MASWAEFAAAWNALAPATSFLATELDPTAAGLFLANGRRQARVNALALPGPIIAAHNPTTALAIASCFKLYVLGELARQVTQGTVTWDQPLALRGDWKSLPSGNMRYEPDGKVFPIHFFAAQMVEFSDNTAADHLMHLLGREQIEGVQAILGHATPARNIPFLLTREFFVMKSVLADAAVAAYVAAPVAERRQLLATEIDPTPIDESDDLWTKPLRITTVEWFAAPADLCRALRGLWVLGRQAGLKPVLDLLALDSGLALDPAVWPYAGFKNGDETGVLSRTWLLQRRDQRWFTFAAVLNDPVNRLDAGAAMTLLAAAIKLLATAP